MIKKCFFGLILFSFSCVLVFAQTYTATDLGNLGASGADPRAINSSGQIVGYAYTASGAYHAFLYANGSMKDLGTLPGGADSIAFGINDSGQVVGWSNVTGGAMHAFLYSNGMMTDLGAFGGTSSIAVGINDSGQIAGDFFTGTDVLTGHSAFVYSGGTLTNLGNLGGNGSSPNGINNNGLVVGSSYNASGGVDAFLYSGGVMTNLGTLGGAASHAWAISNNGLIVGDAITTNGSDHAFLYGGGAMIDLGTLPGGAGSTAYGVNDEGEVVGNSLATGASYAFRYSGGQMIDLNSVTTLPSGVTLLQGNAITDSGQILAYGSDGHAYLLTPSAPVSSAGPFQWQSLTPCRVMDTRNPTGAFGGPYIAATAARTIAIPVSACGAPPNAAAYSLNVTVIPRKGTLGYLTLWPTEQSQPVVSTLNSLNGAVLANAAIVPAGVNGAVNVFATNDTDLVIDINGFFVPPSAATVQFYPLTPCRVLDTRNTPGTFGGPSLQGGASRSFPIPSSACGVPSGAAAYSLNVTAVPQGPLGYLSIWPAGQSQPLVSTLNSLDGTVRANAAIVPSGTNGAVDFFASNTTDIVVDINGYFARPGAGGLNFYSVTPCRVVDTRNAAGTFGGPIVSADTTRTFPLAEGACGLPSKSDAYSLNITVVPSGVLGYLTVWPAGTNQPLTSTLNALEGQVVANAAIVPAGTSSAINVFVTNSTQVIIDTNGYFGQ